MKIEINDNVLKNFYAGIEEVVKKCIANTEANVFYGTVEYVTTENVGGTAVKVAEVKLDGNDFTTPCIVGVNFAKEGDRVVVKINDGEAYIQSNFSKDIIAETLTLTGNSSINLNDKFLVNSDGEMTATAGSFGPMNIVTRTEGDFLDTSTIEILGKFNDFTANLTIDASTIYFIFGECSEEENGFVGDTDTLLISYDGLTRNGHILEMPISHKTIISGISVPGDSYKKITVDIDLPDTEKDYAIPMGIIGTKIFHGDNGKNGTRCFLYQAYVEEDHRVTFGIRNTAASEAVIDIEAHILFSRKF